MCGIAGLFATDRRYDVRPILERLTEGLSHRGPDGSGYRYFGGVARGVGHRRLSIVDIHGGTQPMANEDETVWVVFNGEIYNHLVLRRELERLGHVFRTRADTEVIVHGWEEWGTALFGRLNGMFAVAVYDDRKANGVVWLARDPVGIKPLYLGGDRFRWWFASELQAARAVGLVESEIRSEAIAEYLVYRFVPAPTTPFAQSWKVPAGHYCRIDLQCPFEEPQFEPFAYRPATADVPTTAREWGDALRVAIWQAVDRQLMSDVPLGALLSGGIDSTLVTRIMVERQSAPLGFAIGFDAAGADELSLARRAGRALGVSLVETAVTPDDFIAAWPAQIAGMGEPIANSGTLLVGMLCRVVRGYRKVVLTGQGADEPLGGYPRHVAERFFPVARPMRHVISRIPAGWGNSDQLSRFRRVLGAEGAPDRFAELLAVFSPAIAQSLMRAPVSADALVAPVRRCMPSESVGDVVNQMLVVDRRLSLSDDLLLVMDHMSMASSVEARVPFLDLELLSLIERMPSQLKVSRLGERKWLYRRTVRRDLPPAMRQLLTGWRARTGAKQGFTTPLGAWCESWTGTHGTAYLLGPVARLPAYLDAGSVGMLLKRAIRDPARHQRQILSLYVLETWLRGCDRDLGLASTIDAGQVGKTSLARRL